MPKPTVSTTYFFSQAEHEILKSVCAYMVGVPRDTALDIPIITIDAFVKQLPKALRAQLRFALFPYSSGDPSFFIGKPRHFTQLDLPDAVRYIDTWAKSRLAVRRKLFPGFTRHCVSRLL